MTRARLTAAAVRAGGNRSQLTRAELEAREACEIRVIPGPPKPPAWLPKDAAKRFRTLARTLSDANVVCQADADALARYVVEQMRYEDLSGRYAAASRADDLEQMAPLARLMSDAYNLNSRSC